MGPWKIGKAKSEPLRQWQKREQELQTIGRGIGRLERVESFAWQFALLPSYLLLPAALPGLLLTLAGGALQGNSSPIITNGERKGPIAWIGKALEIAGHALSAIPAGPKMLINARMSAIEQRQSLRAQHYGPEAVGLFKAGKLEEASELLQGLSLNSSPLKDKQFTREGLAMLSHALSKDDPAAVALVAKLNGGLDKMGEESWILMAARANAPKATGWLLEHGAPFNSRSADGAQAVRSAKHPDIQRLLKERSEPTRSPKP